MNARLPLIALALACATASAQKSRFTPDVIRDTTLENGLQVIAIRAPTAPRATVVVAIRGGAYTQESERTAGLPHFIEHLIFKSYSRAQGRAFGTDVGQLGCGYNGTTGDETVMYFVSCPGKNATKAIRVLADLVRNPKFTAEDMKTEQLVVRNELERRVADQRFLLSFMVGQNLWAADWTRKNVGGNVFALTLAQPATLEGLYKQYYTPNNAALIVSGDININDVLSTARSAFNSWKRGPDLPASGGAVTIAPLTASKVMPVTGTSSDVSIEVAWRGPSARADAVGAKSAELFAAWLNNDNSPLQHALVESGLFQSINVRYQLLNQVGPIELIARTSPSRLAEATTALQAELAKLAKPTAFTDEDLRLAKKAWRLDDALEWERGTSIALTISDHWSVAGLPSYVSYGDGIAAQSVDDMRRFMDTYISGKPRVVGVLISPTASGELGAQFQRMMASWNTK